MSSGTKLLQSVGKALERLVTSYETDNRFILNEADLVNRAFEMLAVELPTGSRFRVQSEPRPFIEDQEGKCKIIRSGSWQSQKNENDGGKFDLEIIDEDESHWNRAREKAAEAQTHIPGKLRYWRFLSYPCEAFKSAIEFKVKVRGNLPRIRKDIDKLSALH